MMIKHLTYSSLYSIGVNPLTGEACAFSQRILCDLSEKGAELIRDYLGLPPDTKLAPNWNTRVGNYDAVASVMLDRNAFHALGVFALLRAGYQYVVCPDGESVHFTAFADADLKEYADLGRYLDGSFASLMPNLRVYRNPRSTRAVGSRNEHAFTGRVL